MIVEWNDHMKWIEECIKNHLNFKIFFLPWVIMEIYLKKNYISRNEYPMKTHGYDIGMNLSLCIGDEES